MGEEDETRLVNYLDLFVAIGLLLLCLVTHLKKRLLLPASGVLIVFGTLLGLIDHLIEQLNCEAQFSDSVEKELIELIFLPALITECALSLDWHFFREQVLQILTLAVPAVLLSSVLTAVVIREVLCYDLRWYAALLVGAVLSATDHVSVVAILKEVKADERLMTLMQGETLMNDGTVFVLFTFALRGATGGSAVSEDLVSVVFQQILGGIAFALPFCLATSLWLYFVMNDAVVESLLTLSAAYLLFFTSEWYGTSGALATVMFGLYMSAYGKLFISTKVESSFHFLWTTIGASMEALLLLFCGMLISDFAMDKTHLGRSDFGLLFAFFALQYVVRAVTVLVHWPLLWYLDERNDDRRFSIKRFDYKKVLVLVFGGLKGSMSISLALILHQHTDFSAFERDLMFFWAVGTAGLSNTVGAFALFALVKYLGLEDMNLFDHNLLLSFEEKLRNDTIAHCEKVAEKYKLESISMSHVREKLLDDKFYSHLAKFPHSKNEHGLFRQIDTFEDGKCALSIPLSEHDRLFYLRKLFFQVLKGVYIELFEQHVCNRDSRFILIESVYRGIRFRLRKMDDWDFLERQLQPQWLMKALLKLSKVPLLGRLCHLLRYYLISCAYDVTKNFIRAHEEALELLWTVLDKKFFSEGVREHFREEAKEQVDKARSFLAQETRNSLFRDITATVQTNQMRLVLLYFQQKRMQKLYASGALSAVQHRVAKVWIERQVESEERRFLHAEHDEHYFLRHAYLFERCSGRDFRDAERSTEVFHVRTGEQVRSAHLREGLLLLTKGKLRFTNSPIDYEEGEFLGVENALIAAGYGIDRDADPIVAEKYSIYVYFPPKKLRDFVAQPDLLRRLCVLLAEHAVRTSPERFGDLRRVGRVELHTILHESLLSHTEKDSILRLDAGLFLICGTLSSGIQGPAYVPKQKGEVGSATATLSLGFKKAMAELEDDIVEAVTEFRVNLKASLKPASRTESRNVEWELIDSKTGNKVV